MVGNIKWDVSEANYACPICSRSLRISDQGLRCDACDCLYNVLAGIPDFAVESFGITAGPDLQNANKLNRLAETYGTWP